jgi:hypothetical protein
MAGFLNELGGPMFDDSEEVYNLFILIVEYLTSRTLLRKQDRR